MQPGCMMKILEAEQCLTSADPHEVVLLQQQQEEGKTTGIATGASSPAVKSLENTDTPHLGGRKAEGRDEDERSEAWLVPGRSAPFIGRSPHLRPETSRAKSPPTCSRILALRHGG
jgi:hypothetical protein